MLEIRKEGIPLLLITMILLVSCAGNTKLREVSTSELNLIKKKGLLVLSDERDRPDMYFDIFYPLQDTSFLLTNRNYMTANFDTGFSVGGIPQNVRNELMDTYGEKSDIYPYNMILTLELVFEKSTSFSENAPVDSSRLGLQFKQKWFYKKRTGVAYYSYNIDLSDSDK